MVQDVAVSERKEGRARNRPLPRCSICLSGGIGKGNRSHVAGSFVYFLQPLACHGAFAVGSQTTSFLS